MPDTAAESIPSNGLRERGNCHCHTDLHQLQAVALDAFMLVAPRGGKREAHLAPHPCCGDASAQLPSTE
jgi:hypothetical protein